MSIGWQVPEGGEYLEQWRPEETIKGNLHKLDLRTNFEVLLSSKNKAPKVFMS